MEANDVSSWSSLYRDVLDTHNNTKHSTTRFALNDIKTEDVDKVRKNIKMRGRTKKYEDIEPASAQRLRSASAKREDIQKGNWPNICTSVRKLQRETPWKVQLKMGANSQRVAFFNHGFVPSRIGLAALRPVASVSQVAWISLEWIRLGLPTVLSSGVGLLSVEWHESVFKSMNQSSGVNQSSINESVEWHESVECCPAWISAHHWVVSHSGPAPARWMNESIGLFDQSRPCYLNPNDKKLPPFGPSHSLQSHWQPSQSQSQSCQLKWWANSRLLALSTMRFSLSRAWLAANAASGLHQSSASGLNQSGMNQAGLAYCSV